MIDSFLSRKEQEQQISDRKSEMKNKYIYDFSTKYYSEHHRQVHSG